MSAPLLPSFSGIPGSDGAVPGASLNPGGTLWASPAAPPAPPPPAQGGSISFNPPPPSPPPPSKEQVRVARRELVNAEQHFAKARLAVQSALDALDHALRAEWEAAANLARVSSVIENRPQRSAHAQLLYDDRRSVPARLMKISIALEPGIG